MKYFAICDETTCQLTKNFIFSYRIIDRITEFSFIIFFRFYTFYGAFYFIYSGLSSVIFSPLPIIYCILLFVCHFFNNKPVRARVQFLVYFLFSLCSILHYSSHLSSFLISIFYLNFFFT